MAPLLAALDFLDDIHPLPTTHIPRERAWRKSQISPMGGRIILEVLSCKSETQAHLASSKFVRINVSNGPDIVIRKTQFSNNFAHSRSMMVYIRFQAATKVPEAVVDSAHSRHEPKGRARS